jgi:DNA (cytosine-5)-methyltransferase 1
LLTVHNVLGAFSSNDSADFRQVLTEFVRIADPEAPEVPAAAAWPPGDALLGDGWSVAYRVIDAAAWVPQRRKRIYAVCVIPPIQLFRCLKRIL